MLMSRSLALPACLVLILIAAAASAAEPDPLLQLNDAFRGHYAEARQAALAKAGPIVLVEGDNLVLLRNGKRSEARVIPASYHTLKSIAHIPLGIYVLTIGKGDGPLDSARLAELKAFRDKIKPVRRAIAERGLSETQVQRQYQLIDASTAYLDRLAEAGRFRSEEVIAYIQSIMPAVQANISESAQGQLDGLHRQMSAWRAELPPAEWRQLRVIVMGSALPRRGNLAVQYFARLLGEKSESPRIVYAESVWEEDRALRLLATYMLDAGVGVAFFDDPLRMHRDLLSDAAAEYLQRMKFTPE
jgi:hypothetical protein